MLVHNKNWCRICGLCLTCPRTRKSLFQHGSCHCEERQANHVPPKKVKGELLFSFRYRHLSDEDIAILRCLQLRFKLPTRPVESFLVRANICSTCQQRLRRARLARLELDMSPLKPYTAHGASNAECDSSDVALASLLVSSATAQLQPVASWADHYNAIQLNAGQLQPHMSAMRSTLQLHPAMVEQYPQADPGLYGHVEQSKWRSRACMLPQTQSVQHSMQPATMQLQPNNERPLAVSCASPSEEHADELDSTCVDLDSGAYNASAQGLLVPANIARAQLPLPAASWKLCEQPRHAVMNQNGWPEPPASQQSMPVNVEFRDAANSVLFRESLSLDYPLEDVFYLYYPTAPRSLMFYLEGNVALPKSTTLDAVFSMCSNKRIPVVVWARIPAVINPEHAPQWH
ncbi:hypothetical protein IW146_004805 [Coemansia sp. RSA 922]|nr:hypothetical protein IW146_004805 [Coemansia sp. RSA 922]